MGFDDLNFCAFRQTIDPVSDHAIAGGKTGVNHHFQTVLNTRRDGVLADLILVVQYPDEMTFVTHLQRGGWDHYRVLLGIDQHTGVDELIGEQGVIKVCKARFQLDGAGGGVNLVIEAQQRAFADFLFIGAVPRLRPPAFSPPFAPV